MIRLRVFNVLKHWVDKNFAYDFADDPVASELLRGAIDRLARIGMDRPAAQLTELVQRKRCVHMHSSARAHRVQSFFFLAGGGGNGSHPRRWLCVCAV